MTESELMDLMLKPGYTNPEFEEILRQSNGKVFRLEEDTDIFILRKQLADAKKALTASGSDPHAPVIVEKDVSIPTRDGSEIKVRIHSPPLHLRAKPTAVFAVFHGGGWALGDLDNETLLARNWCSEQGGVCVNVDYRLAPEYKFPTAVYDCYDAVLWTAANASSLDIDLTTGFLIGGISAGANIAATISHLWRNEGRSPPITGIYLSVPATLGPEAVPEELRPDYRSREENARAPILTAGAMNLFHKLYEPDLVSALHSPYLYLHSSNTDTNTKTNSVPPTNPPPTPLTNYPRTYFQICGMDPLRDEGILYERALRTQSEGRAETKVDWYPGLPHSFWSFFPEAEFSRQQTRDGLQGLGWLLGRD